MHKGYTNQNFNSIVLRKTCPTWKVKCYQTTILQKSYVFQSSCNSLLSKSFYVQVLLQVEFNLQLACGL